MIRDNQDTYGRVSRFLHWGMALLLAWQFLSAGAHLLLDDTAVEAFFWPTHKPLGFALFALMILRAAWALIHLRVRPPSVNRLASAGHVALYLLVLLVPALALLRQYGSGRAFEPFGIALMPGFEGERIDWMMAPGNLLHSWLGWLLLVLIVGHVFMAFWHRRRPDRPDVLERMW
ncbi:cytochrome b [Wenzhouxiangella sp. EGI_FJ10409]|uniref:cytochrome b n=1 Tax=Wenzhouxiangella sp. EGI_FJ10409 TaxID=3243767 RepID=UPI0035E202EC